jgi:hypothetical protein
LSSASNPPKPNDPKRVIRIECDLSLFFPVDPVRHVLEIDDKDPAWKRANDLIRSVLKKSLERADEKDKE